MAATKTDYLRIERALSGTVPLGELNAADREFCSKFQPAFSIGRLAGRMAQGYYADKTALEIAKDPRSDSLIPPITVPAAVAVGRVMRKDGTGHAYSIPHYLEYARSNPEMAHDLERVWIAGALLAVGDALKKLRYLDRAPLLELLRHLRNGVAHGNRFHIEKPEQLKKFPAHNRQARHNYIEFEITPQLQGQPLLFDFMGPADALDVLSSIELYLTHIRELVQTGHLNGLLKVLP
jgi:hypothetical protein